MILIINVCKEKLHYYEFVKPIEEILRKNKISFFTKHYKEIRKSDIDKSDKAIICGTSLRDFDYAKHPDKFEWIKEYEKPLLGICAGMQVVGMIFHGAAKKQTEIGYYFEQFDEEFLSMSGEHEVYHLHNDYTEVPRDFNKLTNSQIPQAIKHRTMPIYGVLFHPEVRNKKLVEEFAKL